MERNVCFVGKDGNDRGEAANGVFQCGCALLMQLMKSNQLRSIAYTRFNLLYRQFVLHERKAQEHAHKRIQEEC